MLTITGGENRNFNTKHKIILNYTWNCRPWWMWMYGVMARLSTWILVQISLWRPFAMAALRYSGLLPPQNPLLDAKISEISRTYVEL